MTLVRLVSRVRANVIFEPVVGTTQNNSPNNNNNNKITPFCLHIVRTVQPQQPQQPILIIRVKGKKIGCNMVSAAAACTIEQAHQRRYMYM